MKLSRIRLQEIAGLEPDNIEETRGFTMLELEHDARELLAKIGINNPSTTQLQSVIEMLGNLIKSSGAGQVLQPQLELAQATPGDIMHLTKQVQKHIYSSSPQSKEITVDALEKIMDVAQAENNKYAYELAQDIVDYLESFSPNAKRMIDTNIAKLLKM